MSSSGLTSPRDLAAATQLSVSSLAGGANTPNLNSHLSSMSLGNANQGLGLNLGLLGSELGGLSSFSGLTGLNPNLCSLSNLSNPSLATASSGLQQSTASSSSITSPNSPTTRSTSSTNPQAIIVDDEDDEQDDRNSFQSDSPSDHRQSVTSKQTTASSLRALAGQQSSSNRLSTGSTGSSASIQSSLSQQQQLTPPSSLSLLEHSLINSAHGPAHLPHSLHAHPLSHHQSAALLGLHHQSALQPPHTNSESTTNSISTCATSSSANQQVSTPTAGSHSGSSSHPHSTNTSSANQLHHPYNLSVLNSFPNLSTLNNLNSLNNFPYGSLAAAHHHASNLAGAGAAGQSTQASTIHHHPLFGGAHPQSNLSSNFGSLISEHAPNFGLPLRIRGGSSISSSLSDSRRSSDTALQLESLASKNNFLSAASLNAMSNSSLNQRTQQHLQLLQQLHQHQSHLQQLHQQTLSNRTGQQHASQDSGLDDSEDHFESHEFAAISHPHRNPAANNHHSKGKEKGNASKDGDHNDAGKSKNKRDLDHAAKQLANKSGKQNGHCNNSKLDYHDERDDEDDYSNYNKKKIFIFSGSKQRRHYQSGGGSSNNTNSSGGGGSSNENNKKCSQNTFGVLGCFDEEENEQDDEFDLMNYTDPESDAEANNNESTTDDLVDNRTDDQKTNESCLRFSHDLSAETDDELDRQDSVADKQSDARETELNSSLNSTYSIYSSTGSVMSCCGTALTDVNSSTNDAGHPTEQMKPPESDDGLEDISDEELFESQDTVRQKQADSSNSIVGASRQRKPSGTAFSNDVSPVSNETGKREEKKQRGKKHRTPTGQLLAGVCELEEQLNRPGNEHLTDFLMLAFLRDNNGKADQCMAKLEEGEKSCKNIRFPKFELIN